MFEFVFSLRFLLLIFGALFVAGIYLWGGAKNRRNTNIKYAPRRAQFEPAKRRGGVHGAMNTLSDNDHDTRSEPDVDFAGEIIVDDPAPMIELPSITRAGDDDSDPESPVRKEGQLDLTFESAAAESTADSGDNTTPAEQEVIIALYIKPPSGHEFAGPAIVRSMNSVGLRYGDMDIFHHFGAGDLRTELPLFSVANMVEPGHFDLHDIETFATPGLAMFLRLPSSLDGAVAFELFLNTAQRLAEALSGDLYGAPKKLLDGTAIDKMRQIAAPFANAG